MNTANIIQNPLDHEYNVLHLIGSFELIFISINKANNSIEQEKLEKTKEIKTVKLKPYSCNN